jgi:hypothetical protein
MSALTSLAWCANVASLRASRRAPSRAARARCAVVADAVTTGRAVWLAEDGRKDAPAGAFTQDFLFDLGVPQFPTDSFAPVNGVRFEAGSEAVAVTIERPLGIVFEEKVDGIYTKIVVDEIVPGSNAEKNGDVRVGDVLRITTCRVQRPRRRGRHGVAQPAEVHQLQGVFQLRAEELRQSHVGDPVARRPRGHPGRADDDRRGGAGARTTSQEVKSRTSFAS